MPLQDMSSASVRPTYVARPDQRYATTFLSIKNREYAVRGESIMDKQTGEMFAKRVDDGRVVSFFQNRQYMYDLMLRLKILLGSNPSFKFPAKNESAYYTCIDYDLMAVNNEKVKDITPSDANFKLATGEGDEPIHKIRFKISGQSNGFFCRLTSRDTDKAIIEWLTTEYNAHIKNYEGENPLFKQEREKFEKMGGANINPDFVEGWEQTNASIIYYVHAMDKDGSTIRSDKYESYVRVNEQSLVEMHPDSANLPDVDYYLIEFEEIKFDKLHFMIDHGPELMGEDAFNKGYSTFGYLDGEMYIYYCHICRFVDKSQDIELLGNEFIVALMDVPYVIRYMDKVSTLDKNAAMISSIDRPDGVVWTTNNVWAEKISRIYDNGKVERFDSTTDVDSLEQFLADNVDYVSGFPLYNSIEGAGIPAQEFFLLHTSMEAYTRGQMDTMMAKFTANLTRKIDEIVSTNSNTVGEQGLYIERLREVDE